MDSAQVEGALLGRPAREAITELVGRDGAKILGLGMKLCGNRADAEDLVQETFLQAFRKWEQFEGRSSPSSWLYTIAARVCQRRHRRRAGEPDRMESLDELLPTAREHATGHQCILGMIAGMTVMALSLLLFK